MGGRQKEDGPKERIESQSATTLLRPLHLSLLNEL
jgi:hypothetical protein